jgi:hypothetical protein
MRRLIRWFACLSLALLPFVLTASTWSAHPFTDRYTLEGAANPAVAAFINQADARPYRANVDLDLKTARYSDLVNDRMGLNADERLRISQNGFVVSDRLAFSDFTTAYAWIYWKDLPVLVTTDSILEAIHQTYDDLLKQTEASLLAAKLKSALEKARAALKAETASADPALEAAARDLDTYLGVPLALLNNAEDTEPDVQKYTSLTVTAGAAADVQLFNTSIPVDFTLFQPRGHYTEYGLELYFRAVMWLEQVDFRLVDFDPAGKPVLNRSALAGALLLRDALNQSGGRAAWEDFDMLFTSLIGPADNMTLADLDRFAADAGLAHPADAFQADETTLIQRFASGQYGQTRINGSLRSVAPDNARPLPHAVSLSLLGARYTVDTDIMSRLVFDQLMVNGKKVERPLASPLDVMYALGSDRAARHLQAEFDRYSYQESLAAIREEIGSKKADFWSNSLYNRALTLLRALNDDTTHAPYPQAMQTAAWSDKMLQTQLSSWAQIRHDNILYAKQYFTINSLCEYPAAYVEPYPAFYASVIDYARAGKTLFEQFNAADIQYADSATRPIIQYFIDLEAIAGQLKAIAEKELAHKPLNDDQNAFLKNIAAQNWIQNCGGGYDLKWGGWYTKLFPFQGGKDKNPALVADIGTNPNTDPGSPMYPPRVMHVGTGPVAAVMMMADTGDGDVALYVGPSFTYFEAVAKGDPPPRLTDSAWNYLLFTNIRPSAPTWTVDFRLGGLPDLLLLPDKPQK